MSEATATACEHMALVVHEHGGYECIVCGDRFVICRVPAERCRPPMPVSTQAPDRPLEPGDPALDIVEHQ